MGQRHRALVMRSRDETQSDVDHVRGEMDSAQARGQTRQHHFEHGAEREEIVHLPVEALRLLPERRRRPRVERRGIDTAREVVSTESIGAEARGQGVARQRRQSTEVGDAPAPKRGDHGLGQIEAIERSRSERRCVGAGRHDGHAHVAVRRDAGGRAAIGDSHARLEPYVASQTHQPLAHRSVVADEAPEAVNLHVGEAGPGVLDARRDAERRGEQGVLGRRQARLDERAANELRAQSAGVSLRHARGDAPLASRGVRLDHSRGRRRSLHHHEWTLGERRLAAHDGGRREPGHPHAGQATHAHHQCSAAAGA